jgi:hypothetical protein
LVRTCSEKPDPIGARQKSFLFIYAAKKNPDKNAGTYLQGW